MSRNSRGLLAFLVLLSSICEHVSEGNRVSGKAPTCQLTASEGSWRKFAKQKQKEKRMIHIDIKFHAESKFPKCKSYHGFDTQNRVEPVELTIWHWAQKHTETFLSLPVDFKFASFGVLAEFTSNLTVFMKQHPESCLQCDFSASQLLAQVLLNQVTNRTGVVCHWEKSDSIDLLCCKWDSADNTVKCNMKVERNTWMEIIDKILLLSFVLTMLYSPLLLIYLPRHFVGSELSSKFIVKDLSVNPIHEWTKLKLLRYWPRGKSFKSQFTRFTVLIICPILVCIPFIFYHRLYVRKRLIQQVGESYFDSYLYHFARQLTHTDNIFPKVFYKPVMKYFVYLAFSCYAVSACFLAVWVPDGFECKTCRFCETYVDCNENGKKFSVPDKMILHASPRAIINFVVSSISWVKKRSHRKPIYMRALLVALLVLTIPLVLTAAFLWSLPLTVVYIFVLGRTEFPLTKTREYFLSKMGSIVANIATVLFGILIVLPLMTIGIIMPHLLVVLVVTMLMRNAAYTLTGVLLIGKELLPYISFGIILIANILSYYNSLTTRYLKLRNLLFDSWEKKCQENQEESHQSGPLINYDSDSSVPVIPRKLYNMVCDKVMPRLDAVFIFLVKCIITSILFVFLFSCIKAFAKFESGVETIVDSALTLLVGTLPKLFGLVDANQRDDHPKEIHMQNRIDSVIDEFLEEHVHETGV